MNNGSLTMVATPIGNLEDISYRAVRMLQEADLIAAEDTRHAKILLNRYDITTRLTSYHMHNERRKTEALLNKVEDGMHVAMLTDAGTPCISDPGFFLVRAALARGIEPDIIPGASALMHTAVGCGFPVHRFMFAGFLPPKGKKRLSLLREYSEAEDTFFLFESPHRIGKLLAEIVEALGPDTRVAVIREATKKFEERLRGTAAELVEANAGRKWKGEVTVAIHCPDAQEA